MSMDTITVKIHEHPYDDCGALGCAYFVEDMNNYVGEIHTVRIYPGGRDFVLDGFNFSPCMFTILEDEQEATMGINDFDILVKPKHI